MRYQYPRYRVCLAPKYDHQFLRVPKEVQFIAHYGLPLPSPRYLGIHAACCRIAWLSGAAEYLDTILRDMDDLKVLAEDGSSVEVFGWALQGLRVVPPP